ncbi:hypothetical protein AVEN_274420-1 [Araneus ventricosus]|uniref:Reverse transcriptase zinc-binding domain-containing protein n=1 Tax=Araneus ventricosus TaxID=182803 RepID=A0A4Y2E5K3_ARAVE|nr:hypothetical protein AVEN_274420-1 [Araneus ventricosus]
MPNVSDIPSPWTREVINFVTGHAPFPCFLKRFNLYRTNHCACGVVGDPLHFATDCPLIVSFYMTKPSDHLTEHWWKSCLSNKYSRSKIIQLVNFLTDKGVWFKLDTGIHSNFQAVTRTLRSISAPVTRHS